jgi:heme-degrading monooxygenase HmoA
MWKAFSSSPPPEEPPRHYGQDMAHEQARRHEGFQLAQVNIARPVEPLTSPRLAEFMALLEPVNAMADTAPGFVWRLQTEDGDATAVRAFGDDELIVNMSVWESVEAFAEFVFGGFHAEVMRRRREWFAHLREPYSVAWWVATGQVPTLDDAEERLASLRKHGPTPYAFTMQRAYPPPGSTAAQPSEDDWFCPV